MSNANHNGSKNVSAAVLLSLLKSGQWLALSSDFKGGLIIRKRFYADFVGSGAAVGGCLDVNCTCVYVLGTVQFYAPATYKERASAFGQRIACIERLKEILLERSRLRRAYSILGQLSRWVGADAVKNIPDELVAQLAGLLPTTVKVARQRWLAATISRKIRLVG